MDEQLSRPPGSRGQPEMVERIARAIRKVSYGTERGWAYEAHEAWAALEAMCKPTQAMLDAAEGRASVVYNGTTILCPADAWDAMVKEAMRVPLTPPNPSPASLTEEE